MRLIHTHSMGSDCTAPYDVEDYKAKTVREFIEELLKERRNEFGEIEVKIRGSWLTRRCKFNRGKLESEMSPDVIDFEVEKVIASGGWGRMDYRISVKRNEL